MDKHLLNKIHETEDGHHVRSKSEVIISNMLFNAGIDYKYEEKLYYGAGATWIEPDFTITKKDGTKVYWEHVGLLGNESYDLNWLKKLDIYEKYFPNQMIRTYESGALSKDVKRIIETSLS